MCLDFSERATELALVATASLIVIRQVTPQVSGGTTKQALVATASLFCYVPKCELSYVIRMSWA